jgi:hypothetical protein
MRASMSGKRPFGRAAAGAAFGCCGLIVLATLTGCRGQQTSASDPFLPFMKTRVPPPGTTIPPGTVGDPYYQNGAPVQGAPAAVVAPPPGATPASPPTTPDKYSPPNGFNFPQGSIDRSKAVDPKAREQKVSGTAVARRTLSTPSSGRSEVDTQLTAAKSMNAQSTVDAAADPNAQDASNPSTREIDAVVAFGDSPQGLIADAIDAPAVAKAGPVAAANGRLSQLADDGANSTTKRSTLRILAARDESELSAGESEAVELAGTAPAENATTRLHMTAGEPQDRLASKLAEEYPDQPRSFDVADGDAAMQFRAGQASGGVVQASYVEPQSPHSAAVPAAAASAAGAYRHEQSYAALGGKLEYSQRTRQWKLRYIPIDGTTDQFGGSVVLADSAKLEGFKPGDFVNVRGGISAGSQDTRAFSPRYELSQIEPAN